MVPFFLTGGKMSIKISLTKNPTFDAIVEIPVPGKGIAKLGFTFKYRTRDEFNEWRENELKGLKNVEAIKSVATAWKADDEFNDENLAAFDQLYMQGASAILETYIFEQSGARIKN